MFVVSLTYVKPLEEIEKLIVEHREFLTKYYESKKFILSGAKVPRDGGMIIVNSDSLDEVKGIMQEDPFWRENVAEYDFVQFTPSMHDKRLDNLL